MTVSETLAALKTQKGIEPKASYTGTEDTDDFIFAVQTDSSSQTKESAWIVCADHVKEHSGALNATTTDEAFIRTGTVTSKTGTQRTFSINGNRCVGDDFQDFALSHKIKYGTGSDVIVPYIYFSIRTGKGESGAPPCRQFGGGGAANAFCHLCDGRQGRWHSGGVRLHQGQPAVQHGHRKAGQGVSINPIPPLSASGRGAFYRRPV